jgi:hypothetical protein
MDTYNLSQAARIVGVSRQRIHQIAWDRGIGIARLSTGGKRLRWSFSQDEVDDMEQAHGKWAVLHGPFRMREDSHVASL